MKKAGLYLWVICLNMLVFSCQDKYLMGYTPPAKGTLKSDSTGNCLPKTIAGTYTSGKALGDTNYLMVTVHVVSSGTYSIRSNTVNGISFAAAGTFAVKGLQTVKLAAKGQPVSAGNYNFTVSFDTSTCHISLSVLPVGGMALPDAVFTLSGAPNACTNAVLAGSFVKGVLLDTASKISVSVNVGTAGKYNVSTNTVNGYSFSGSGTFTTTGAQTLALVASGTPQLAGTDVFTIAGSSSCGFSVPVLTPIAVAGTDHFPLTKTSNWSYDDLFNTGDTLSRNIVDTIYNINGSSYTLMQEQQKSGNPVPFLYRRIDSVYYENTSIDKYTSSVKFSPQIVKDFPFLREFLSTGDTWTTEEYIGMATFGQQIFLRYDFICQQANAAVTLTGKTFANVYKILMLPKIRSATTYPYNSTSEQYTIWYAKGVGIIYSKKINNSFLVYENQIRNWVVK